MLTMPNRLRVLLVCLLFLCSGVSTSLRAAESIRTSGSACSEGRCERVWKDLRWMMIGGATGGLAGLTVIVVPAFAVVAAGAGGAALVMAIPYGGAIGSALGMYLGWQESQIENMSK